MFWWEVKDVKDLFFLFGFFPVFFMIETRVVYQDREFNFTDEKNHLFSSIMKKTIVFLVAPSIINTSSLLSLL